MRSLCLLLIAPCLLGSCGSSAPPPFVTNCTVPAPSSAALLPAGPVTTQGQAVSTWIQPGGRALTPAGRLLTIGGFPLAVRPLPAPYGNYVVVTTGGQGDNALMLVDTQGTGPSAIVSNIDYPAGDGTPQSPALFYGLALSQLGGTLRIFASCGGYDVHPAGDPSGPTNVVDVYDVSGTPPTLQKERELFLPAVGGAGPYPAGLALSADQKLLYVAGQATGTLSIFDVNPADGNYGNLLGTASDLGYYPYDVAIDDMTQRAYVSLWGGQVTGGTPPLRDGLAAVDVSNPMQPMLISDTGLSAMLNTGKSSEQLLLSGRQLYVAAADADRLTALDLDDLASPLAMQVGQPLQNLLGASPGAVALDPTTQRLYVTTAYDNAVVVLSAKDLSKQGRIPTAAYPTAVTVLADGTLIVTNGKGLGTFPTDQAPTDGNNYSGVLEVIDSPSAQDLVLGDMQVQANNQRPLSYVLTPTCPATERRFALPVQPGDPTPIQHVFFIVKENKTYDVYFGDQPGTNGSADLALFGQNNTPNQHALAAAFTNLDNFYADSDASIQGHEWTSSAFSNDFTEKAWLTTWGRGSRPEGIFAGTTINDYIVDGAAGSMFESLDKAKISYHNYGEIVNSASAKVGLDPRYPGVVFDLDIPDLQRAQYLVTRLQDPQVQLERFHYILFPRDHTYGTSPGEETPQSMVADNDQAVGVFIDGLSHSPYWSSSVVFITEDDPSDGADHVDHRRSVCLAVGPWIRRQHVSSVNYDFPSLWRTMEMLLGLPPMNQLDAQTAPMYDLFSAEPDYTPYTALPRQIPVAMNGPDAPMAEESKKIDFSRPDTAPLGRILWRAVRGTDPPYGTKPLDRDDD